MTTPDAPVWRTIARAWNANKETIEAIAIRTGTTAAAIKSHARLKKWTSRPKLRRVQLASKPATKKSRASPKSVTRTVSSVQAPPDTKRPTLSAKPANSLSAKRALIRRMYSAIDTKLQLLEKHMQSDLARLDTGTDSSAADHERDTRAIGTLIKNLGTIADIDHANKRPKSSDAKSGGPKSSDPIRGSARVGASSNHRNAPTDLAALADEADRYRRELAARLRRVVDAQS
jgi:hypothetical protein